jgi:membrane protein insertase Oxa1/YidC/SpoIIIJ
MSQASPNFRMAAKLYKHSELPIHKRIWHLGRALVDYSKQTNTSLLSFYFYNIVQIPVFIVMVLSIRKISFENEELTGAGALWFKDLNEPDAYLVLPIIATTLNYFNLGVSIIFCLIGFL